MQSHNSNISGIIHWSHTWAVKVYGLDQSSKKTFNEIEMSYAIAGMKNMLK